MSSETSMYVGTHRNTGGPLLLKEPEVETAPSSFPEKKKRMARKNQCM
jgi:hypothetical protein